MRKQIVLGLTLLLALAVAAFAGEKATPRTTTGTHGDIASIDATAQTFTVTHGKDTSTFKTDENTKYIGHLDKTLKFSTSRCAADVPSSRTAPTRWPPASTWSTARRRCNPDRIPERAQDGPPRGPSPMSFAGLKRGDLVPEMGESTHTPARGGGF